MMDYMVLLISRKILKCTATHGNICLGSLTGSLLTCIVIIIPVPYTFIKLIMFHLVVNTIMIKIGLKIKDKRTFLKAFITLYISSFLLGGVLEYLQQYVRIGSLFFGAAIGSYYVVSGIWWFIVHLQRINQCRYQVTLYVNGTAHVLEALLDTGNSLQDELTGKPVCIIDRETAKNVLNNSNILHMRYIPYHTIGESTGMMPIFKLDKMCIHKETTCWIKEPLIGVSEQCVSTEKEYQMILNPDIF